MRWWRTQTPSTGTNVEVALRDQEAKVAQEKAEIAGLEARMQSDHHMAQRKLVLAQEISHETEKVTAQIRQEETKNGLANLFRRGLSGGVL